MAVQHEFLCATTILLEKLFVRYQKIIGILIGLYIGMKVFGDEQQISLLFHILGVIRERKRERKIE
jgi:hypothetical protein